MGHIKDEHLNFLKPVIHISSIQMMEITTGIIIFTRHNKDIVQNAYYTDYKKSTKCFCQNKKSNSANCQVTHWYKLAGSLRWYAHGLNAWTNNPCTFYWHRPIIQIYKYVAHRLSIGKAEGLMCYNLKMITKSAIAYGDNGHLLFIGIYDNKP
jgi:hypothetical protein